MTFTLSEDVDCDLKKIPCLSFFSYESSILCMKSAIRLFYSWVTRDHSDLDTRLHDPSYGRKGAKTWI